MKRDLHAEVTERLLDALRSADGKKWRPPWVSMAATGLPHNAATGARYRGVNILNLWMEAQLRGFGSRRWASFRQWASIDAQVRKGEKAARVVFYKSVPRREAASEDEGDEGGAAGGRQVPVMRYSSVFNADQVEGYEDPEAMLGEPSAPGDEPMPACEAFVVGVGAEIRRNAGRAFYDSVEDYVGLPADELFHSTAARYSTTFHELTHWTGHPSRLNRGEGMEVRFGSRAYAAEELVAELGAAFLCAGFGFEPEAREEHAAYIKHWIALLEDDSKAIFTAAARASDAVEFLERETGDGEQAKAPAAEPALAGQTTEGGAG